MIWEGMVEEGLSICRAVHERYHPSKRNPYNEVECSDHYSRAMASWGVFTALSGFSYNGPAGRIGFAPRVTPEEFKSAFTTAEGWGTFSQKISAGRHSCHLSMAWGRLRVHDLSFQAHGTHADVSVEGRPLDVTASQKDGMLHISLPRPITLKAGQAIEIVIT
ncbi:hypothetical protein OP10G_1032 [Fimbriimonas ginsengisoli Gsoil 348]|uniref:Uncharacterized protein n=2 Tax=Fimbriimonas ginsengisoli TaxID=1005039 RepID=A0A068NNR3_FIMGI|nr:hypothetical protein OP10G_1032 [Fimbriimonas ginsengisoli Gsoil 348]